MNIILSRKGFDSACGGAPSPIFPDGRIASLPIPASGAQHPYRAIRKAGRALGPVVRDLTRARLHADTLAHLDPDLDATSLPRRPGWRPAFGQTGAAATHLARMGVGPGDLFLFFGWFRQVAETPQGWRVVPRTPDRHILFGWLQIAEVMPIEAIGSAALLARRPWLHDHPHLHFAPDPRNTLYLATERLALPGTGRTDLPGAGEFPRLRPGLVLTSPEARTRSSWRLPAWFAPDQEHPPLTYHADLRRWTPHPNGVRLEVVAQGQEFVLDCRDRPQAAAWALELIAQGLDPIPETEPGYD